MRNISFALTTEQIRNQTKTVTRRIGWTALKPGTMLQPVEKCQGLKKGEQIKKIGVPIRVVSVRREPLIRIVWPDDVVREGFPGMTAWEFIRMFCKSHRVPKGTQFGTGKLIYRSCEPTDEVTRIEFEYCNDEANQAPTGSTRTTKATQHPEP